MFSSASYDRLQTACVALCIGAVCQLRKRQLLNNLPELLIVRVMPQPFIQRDDGLSAFLYGLRGASLRENNLPFTNI